jgi:hypothetical protein
MMKPRFSLVVAALLILVCLAGQASAEQPYMLLSAKTDATEGALFAMPHKYREFTCQVSVTGSPAAVTVQLRGNLSGTTTDVMAEYSFDASHLAAGFAIFGVTSMPAYNISGKVTTLTGGTSPSVSMVCAGVE